MTDHKGWKRLLVRALEWVMPYSLWLDVRFELRLSLLRITNSCSPIFLLKVRRLSRRTDSRIHLACGDRYLTGWINIDGPTSGPVDIRLDLRRKFPLPAHQADVVFCEHFVEHLGYRDTVVSFLTECRRLLKPEGVLRLSVPDGGKYLQAYAENDRSFFSRERPACATRMLAVNDVFRQGGQHQFAYDFETLASLLRSAGYEDVRQVDFNRSRYEWFNFDSPARAGESLYVEASTNATPPAEAT
jgi:predicted SAM-dependent methyltransferase